MSDGDKRIEGYHRLLRREGPLSHAIAFGDGGRALSARRKGLHGTSGRVEGRGFTVAGATGLPFPPLIPQFPLQGPPGPGPILSSLTPRSNEGPAGPWWLAPGLGPGWRCDVAKGKTDGPQPAFLGVLCRHIRTIPGASPRG